MGVPHVNSDRNAGCRLREGEVCWADQPRVLTQVEHMPVFMGWQGRLVWQQKPPHQAGQLRFADKGRQDRRKPASQAAGGQVPGGAD
jgi:hypothetical protein